MYWKWKQSIPTPMGQSECSSMRQIYSTKWLVKNTIDRFQISNLVAYLKTPEQQEKPIPKKNKLGDILKLRLKSTK